MTEHTGLITTGVTSAQPTRGTVAGMRRSIRLTPRSHRTASGSAATGNDLHDAYVQSVNAALAAGREHVARELAADYDHDRRAAGPDRQAA